MVIPDGYLSKPAFHQCFIEGFDGGTLLLDVVLQVVDSFNLGVSGSGVNGAFSRCSRSLKIWSAISSQAYNLNEPEYRNENHIYDGMITISRGCFAEPEIHEKLKKMPSGRKKLITKRIPVDVDYPRMISEGRIVIENYSNCWHCSPESNVDVMALHILFKLFMQYQEEGKMPEHISYNV